MAASVHVVARYLTKPGKKDEVRGLLTALIAPSRREIGRYQYDLLRNPGDPRDFCFVDRWEDDQAVDQQALVHNSRPADSDLKAEATHRPILYDSGRPRSVI